MHAGGAEFGIGGLLCFLPFLIIAVGGTIFWIWMLIDCLLNESSEGMDKLVWAVVILLTHLLGAALYFFIRRPKRLEELGR